MSKAWSEPTKAFTRQVFEDLSFVSRQGKVWLKHTDDCYGYINDADALRGRYVIHAPSGNDLVIFDSIANLIDSGWTLD